MLNPHYPRYYEGSHNVLIERGNTSVTTFILDDRPHLKVNDALAQTICKAIGSVEGVTSCSFLWVQHTTQFTVWRTEQRTNREIEGDVLEVIAQAIGTDYNSLSIIIDPYKRSSAYRREVEDDFALAEAFGEGTDSYYHNHRGTEFEDF